MWKTKLLHTIAEHFIKYQGKIEEFIRSKSQGLKPPLYLSCDLRNSGKKVGVIDTNLFPAGFNNLCNAYSRVATLALRQYFDKYLPATKKIILLVEEHTRNRFYLENVSRLASLLETTGLSLRLAYPGVEIREENLDLTLSDGKTLHLQKLQVHNGVPQVKGFEAELIISNNDFSTGIPDDLKPIADKIIPSPFLGWHQRRKSHHFSILQELVRSFAQTVDLDPWLLHCEFEVVEPVDLTCEKDLRRLADGVLSVLKKVQSHYDQFKITDPPYVFVKNNSGTYGMGLIEVMAPEEILQMNRRMRNKLLSAKGGQKANSFLIQEGIPTADFYSGLPIEPVIYLVGFDPVGGFFRMNEQADALTSLNTRGMAFSCLCLHKLDEPHELNFLLCAEKENLVSLASTMGRLAAIAAAREMKETVLKCLSA